MAWAGRPQANRDVFRAVADPTRRATLEALGRAGELPVSTLAEAIGVELTTLSRHLAVLRDAGLVTQKQAGRQRLYRLEPEPLRQLFDWAGLFSELWGDRTGNRRTHPDRRAGQGRD